MQRQSRQIGITVLQTLFASGGNYVTVGTSGVSAALGLSLVYTPTPTPQALEVEIEALVDCLKAGGSDVWGFVEIWKNGVFWRRFGSPAGYADSANLAYQSTGSFIDTIPANSTTPITYSLQGACQKLNSTVTSSFVQFNWGANPSNISMGGGTVASYLKLMERLK